MSNISIVYRTKWIILSRIGIALGTFCIFWSAYSIFQTQRFISHAEVTSGRIEKIEKVLQSRKKTGEPVYYFYPVIAFEVRGSSYVFTSKHGSVDPEYMIHEAVPVLYLSENPNEAEIDDPTILWRSSILLFMVGFISIITNIAVLRKYLTKT